MDEIDLQTRSPLWIDQPDALDRLADLPLDARTRADTEHFITRGYTIFRGAVSHEVIDRVLADTRSIFQEPERYVVRDKGAYVDPVQIRELNVGHRIIDLYAISAAARDAVFAPTVANMLHAVFGEPAIGIQSLSFEYGSQQAIHQDTAYVVSARPMSLAATWIALEDVAPGTGELIFYPGGHRFDHYLFSGRYKGWSQQRDGQESHREYLAQLHAQAQARGLEIERFLPKKGDVLVWHADLPHGGSRITQHHTRRSLVTHFAGASVGANYRKVIGENYHELAHDSGHRFTSRHYLLRQLDEQGRGSILFDGGVSKRRLAEMLGR